jgi:hypothetical protein
MPRKSRAKSNWKREWREQCRRGLDRSMEDRMRYGFVYTYKPVLDDAPYRIFSSMAEYRDWCEANLPRYLGYYRPDGKGRKR